ncbi:FAD-binding oxidoreductase [candidate division WOR-3 bacterium]|nr:FAD-binding oxidoreductase [candidate division WOR-3 bacterium]
MYDLVIIGGGIIGGASLYYLLEKGFDGKILVLERGDALAQESTSLSAGGVRNIWSTKVNMKMTSYSIKQFSEFKDRFGINIGFEMNGYLFTYYEKEWENIVKFKPNWDESGVDTELLSPEEIESMIPGLKTGVDHLDPDILEMLSISPIVGGLFGRGCAILNATSAAQAYFEYSTSKHPEKVTVRLNTEVDKIIIKGDDVKGVKTKEGDEIPCGGVILAAGAWSAEILERSDVQEDLNIPVVPIKRMLFVVSQPKSINYEKIPLTIIDKGVYFRTEAENLIVGCADKNQRPGFDTKPDRTYYEDYVNLYMQARIDGAEYCRIQNMWGGLYAVNTEDHNAIIDVHPVIKNLYINTGFSGHGIMAAPAAALSITEIIMDGEMRTIPDACSLNLERFKKRELVIETIVI